MLLGFRILYQSQSWDHQRAGRQTMSGRNAWMKLLRVLGCPILICKSMASASTITIRFGVSILVLFSFTVLTSTVAIDPVLAPRRDSTNQIRIF